MPLDTSTPQKRSAAGALTLPGRYYTSEEIFARERKRIFEERWLCVGHGGALAAPGDYRLVDVAGESLVLVRGRDDRLRAFYNVCRHRGCRLTEAPEGTAKGGLQCPYHAWTYALTGELVGAPNMGDVEGFRQEEHALRQAAVAVWEGLVFVSLAEEPRPFETSFAPLLGKFDAWRLPELCVAHRTEYRVEANWKLLFQNYSECYHCPTVHPLLNRLTPYKDSINDLEEGPILGGPMRLARSGGSMTMDGGRCAAPLGEVSGDDLDLVHYYTLFPSLFLSFHPDYVLVHRAKPERVDRTRIVCEWFFHPRAMAEDDFDAAPAVEFWDLTNRQDWQLCEMSQKGIASRAYAPGPYSDLESQLAAFDREYLRALEG